MMITILIAFFSLIGLIVLHEFGHFILAKKFGVKVEEFGIGYPPKLFGKKFGETIYSLNLLPFGAFVRIQGEEKRSKDNRSFSQKPIWQRALIILGGVVSFWIISVILLSIVMTLGAPTTISDEENRDLKNAKVQILAVSPQSPAEISKLQSGDTIQELRAGDSKLTVTKVKEVQEFTQKYKGKEVTLKIERGKEVFEVSLIPRTQAPEGEGAMGLVLVRTAIKSYPPLQAIWQGGAATFNLTIAVVEGWYGAIKNISQGLPSGVQMMGPVGIFSLFTKVSQLGVNYFLQFIAIISVYLALFNILPIPAVDGGKLLFLGIEAFRRKPVSEKIEQKVTTFFFALLIIMMIWVTIKDVARFF